MPETQLDRFLAALARHWQRPATLLLTSAQAASAWGRTRHTHDVDFEVSRVPARLMLAFDQAVHAARRESGLEAQYSTRIDRWSEISLLAYRRTALPLKRCGSIQVRVLDPLHWSIGKVSRYLNSDTDDLIAVFRRVQPDPLTVARLWARALRQSPPSSQLWPVQQQMLDFFRRHGRAVWKRPVPLERIERLFAGKRHD